MTSPHPPRHDPEAQRDLTENQRVDEAARRRQTPEPPSPQAPFEHDTGQLARNQRRGHRP
ncbi:MAG TPA: hypothetical protein VLC08_00890 [Chitinolyticbacter sp.]|nr:hypothetical protein [Chitinolyticbacter sp.]